MQTDDIFPALIGLAWDRKWTPAFSTGVQSSKAMREVRISYASAPVYTIKLTHELLRAGSARGDALRVDLDVLADFFHAHLGRARSFLFRHWYDRQMTNELLGTGDGVTTAFPVGRQRAGGFEPVWWVDGTQPIVIGPLMWRSNPAPMWQADSVVRMWHYAFETTAPAAVVAGMLQLPSAPPAGQAVYYSASFFYRARFESDEQEFNNFMSRFWSNTVTLRATLGNKL